MLALLPLLAGPVAAPALAQPHPARVAPADEYFGRLKMSILGVGNELRDLAVRISYAPGREQQYLGAVTMVEDAIRDWERKYPSDPWLAKDVFALSQLYERIPTPDGQRHAAATLQWLVQRYPGSAFAHVARTEMK
jgi:outer membrane protein assembly factor BamD (BamD/ComL family)